MTPFLVFVKPNHNKAQVLNSNNNDQPNRVLTDSGWLSLGLSGLLEPLSDLVSFGFGGLVGSGFISALFL
ncbi:hypothetical protein VCRA2122O339_10087 [Vibrio crassostreae]|nr:hypothetical protein VCRA2120E331_20163 [Vibrio crassostreae]CAK3320758.1 hypothetical protein VCRA2122O339_10087 [Vibrio crassostreae]CAK3410740.1 hypothetical protein VCRA2127O345_20089 [Vibrio crassostreae]CAK3422601.1 hypothetical protein VCRA2120E330_20087 [Vibrio crassostreae]CAK3455975.1 hypothetical protein VCRA2122O338_20163 [Vibrio crassostreae]